MKFKTNKEQRQKNKENLKTNLKKNLISNLNLIKNLNNLKNNLHFKEILIPIDYLQLMRDLWKSENHKELNLIIKDNKISLRRL